MSQSRDEYYQENPEEYQERVEPGDASNEPTQEEAAEAFREAHETGSAEPIEETTGEDYSNRTGSDEPTQQEAANAFEDYHGTGSTEQAEEVTGNDYSNGSENGPANQQEAADAFEQYHETGRTEAIDRMAARSDRTRERQDTETNTPESIDSEQAQSLRSEVAGSTGVISVSDVSIRETGGGYEAFVPEPRQRQIVREQTASNFDVLGPSDVSVRETNDGLAGFLGDDARREVAANRLDVSPGDIVLGNGDVRYSESYAREQYADELGSEFTGSDVNVSRADDSWQLEGIDFVGDRDISDSIASGPQTSDVGQTTVTGFDPDAQPDSWSDALINSDTSERVAATETILPSGAITRLQDAGAFVGEELSERGESLGETVSAPVGGQAGDTLGNVVAGATGSAPAAIAAAPGEAALGVERATQATTVALRDPSAAPDVARTAAGFGVAGAEGTAQAIAAEPAREGTAALTLAGGTALATRGTARAAREWEMPDAASGTRARDLLTDERAQASLTGRSRAREPTIGADEIADPDSLGREVTELEYGEYQLGPDQPTRLEGMTPDMGGGTRRIGQAQRQSVRDTDTALPAAGTAGLVAGEMGRVEAAGAQSVQALEATETLSGIGLQADVRPVAGTEQAFGFESERSATATRTTTQTTSETTRPIPGTPSLTGTNRRPVPPAVPELPELSGGRSDDRMDDVTGFGSLEVGDYIDIV